MLLTNDHLQLEFDDATGVIRSFAHRGRERDLVAEPRLASLFRMLLPLPDCACNYIEAAEQSARVERLGDDAVRITYEQLRNARGTWPVRLECTIRLAEAAAVFSARLTNPTAHPVAEFWYPRVGGLRHFLGNRDAVFSRAEYMSLIEQHHPFTRFPGGHGLGAPAAEWSGDYPGPMPMPWCHLHDPTTDTGLYLGYHDRQCRFSTWALELYPTVSGAPDGSWLAPEQCGGRPLGLVFAHIRYPYTRGGQTLDSGEFVMQFHDGDWHRGGKLYRAWFEKNFPLPRPSDWLRQQQAWYSCILLQPEDGVAADYATFDRWCADAARYGVGCVEMLGWDVGGIERDYPIYEPDDRLGGWAGYRKLHDQFRARQQRCLTFVNYNILDSASAHYPRFRHLTRQDTFGTTPNWMAWGESTFTARRGISVRRHLLASVTPELEELIATQFERLVDAGAEGFQIDKIAACQGLDFNPLSTWAPDLALTEALVQAVERLAARLKQRRADVAIASEAGHDRLMHCLPVFYRCGAGTTISTLRYVFPEWTSCLHVAYPRDFNTVNGAVLTGAVIVVEPDSYQGTLGDPLWADMGRYVEEIIRLRAAHFDRLFLAEFIDHDGASLAVETQAAGGLRLPTPGGASNTESLAALAWAVHRRTADGKRALVVVNTSAAPAVYRWRFADSAAGASGTATLVQPFTPSEPGKAGDPVTIPGQGLHVWLE